MQTERWLTVAGFMTWLASSVPAGLAIAGGRIAGASAAAWAAGFVAFGIAFGRVCFGRAPSVGLERGLVFAQALAGLVMLATARDGFAGATLVVASAQLPDLFPPRATGAWVAVQTAALTALFWWTSGRVVAFTAGGAYLGFQTFAITTATLAQRERAARCELARANAELLATRSLLAENSRVAERLRISRDLHDTLGHHLTALILQLEVAGRLASGQAADHLREAHTITRLLLGDVRDVVSRMRDNSRFDLAEAIRALAESESALDIHVDVPDVIEVDDPLQAYALFCCVREAITNTTRHASARNLWIRVEQQAGGIALTARDDGHGVAALSQGNGLRGMRERFEEYAGKVEFSSSIGRGFEVRAFMPREKSEGREPVRSAAAS